jgi:hypothetical protein
MGSLIALVRLFMLSVEEHSYHLQLLKPQLLWKRWHPTKVRTKRTQTRKRGGGMHQLKEVDMLSSKMDLLMKRLDERAGEKKEVMHIHDYRMTCEECGETRLSGISSQGTRGCKLPQQQQQLLLSSSIESTIEPIVKA